MIKIGCLIDSFWNFQIICWNLNAKYEIWKTWIRIGFEIYDGNKIEFAKVLFVEEVIFSNRYDFNPIPCVRSRKIIFYLNKNKIFWKILPKFMDHVHILTECANGARGRGVNLIFFFKLLFFFCNLVFIVSFFFLLYLMCVFVYNNRIIEYNNI